MTKKARTRVEPQQSGLKKLTIQKIPLSKMNPAPYNPRKDLKPGDPEYIKLERSIDEFGMVEVLVWNKRTGNLVGGHQRYKVLQSKGAKVADTSVVDLDLAREKLLNIALNKIRGAWDEVKLKGVLGELSLEFKDLDVAGLDLDLTGFGSEELDALFEGKSGEGKEPQIEILKHGGLEQLAPTEEEMKVLAGRKVVVEFSGGKDSSAAAVWVKRFLPDAEVVLCFCDLGADYPGFNIHLKQFSEALGYPLKVVRSKENIIDAFLEEGKWPHFSFPYCHKFLHGTLDTYYRTYPKAGVVIVRGGRAQEKARRSTRQKDRFLAMKKTGELKFFQPLYFADKDIGTSILEKSGLPIWDGYGRGLLQTACRICPGQRIGTYATIKKSFPDIWAELMYLEKRLGPGCWQDPKGKGRGSFAERADRGSARKAGKGR